MKKIIAFAVLATIFVIVISLLWLFYTQNQKISVENKLMEVFASTGARGLSREVYIWGRPDQRGGFSREILGGPDESLDAAIDELCTALQVEINDVYERRVNGTLPEGDSITITGKILSDDQVHLFVNVIGNPASDNPGSVEKAVREVCKKHGFYIDVNYCITGYFDGKLDLDEINEVCRKVFNAAGAKEVDGISDESLTSITAYSPDIENYTRVGGSRVNINVAFRYNSYEKRTYIWLANPLITIEY